MTPVSIDTEETAKPNRIRSILSRLTPLIGLALFGLAMWAMHREIQHFKFDDLRAFIGKLSAGQIALAAGATVLGYISLICYDLFALRYVGHNLALRRVSMTAFIGQAFSMNIGQSVLSGGAVRLRLYSGWGIGAGDISRILGFNFVTNAFGMLLISGIAFTFSGVKLPEGMPIPSGSLRVLGFAMLCVVATYIGAILLGKKEIRIRKFAIPLPSASIAIPAVMVAAIDWSLTSIVLYALLPPSSGVTPFGFLGIVMAAHNLAGISMVPGGLGVFESIVLHLLPENMPHEAILSALVAYRAIYYFFPFIVAILLLGGHELFQRRKGISGGVGKVTDWLTPAVPQMLAAMAFVAGALLLLSGATPAIASRLAFLERWIPLFALELSHFLVSIVGVSLIVLSSALRRRVDAAWTAVVILLSLGIIVSLVKGLDYEEAAVLTIILLVMFAARRRFDRHAAIFGQRFTRGWWTFLALIVGCITWIGFTAYERVNYHPGLWIHFGITGDASRFLRSSAGIATALAAFAVMQLFRPTAKIPPEKGDASDLEKALPMVARSEETSAWLAMLGDKHFLFSESEKSAIMFGIRGRSWISMGDPLGDPEETESIAWTFLEKCDQAGSRAVFYQIRPSTAHTYAALGMLLYKLGEEARVDLRTFTMAGSSKKGLRHSKSRLDRDVVTFEIIPATRFDEFSPELKRISDSWLSEKSAAEKSFSLGSYRKDYLRHFDIAIVRHHGVIVAFSNILKSGKKQELSVDLMRHSEDAPPGVMAYLFIELIAWGQEQGFQWFNLGMAPLSGLENRSLAPLWNRLGAQIFTLGEHFYNFQGLRAYKEKFDPVWEPRYLACRNTAQLPFALLDIAALIGGGIKQTMSKSK